MACPSGQPRAGGGRVSFIRSTFEASPTTTATESGTSQASVPASTICIGSGSTLIWVTPWYSSPLADGGYDIADYRAIDPNFGDLSEAESLISEALGMGIRTIIDVVPNHVSYRHPWFEEALASPAGSPQRSRFWFHPGKGESGEEIPTRWVSSFAGETWTRTVTDAGEPGEWYLHLFTPQQPDLNWSHPQVRSEHEDVLRFWFDRGVAGIRIDSAALLVKDPELPEVTDDPHTGPSPLHRSRRAPRHLSIVAPYRGLLSAASDPGW